MKSVLITGVCGGIGHATAAMLANENWQVYGVDVVARRPGLQLAKFWQGNVVEEAFWRDVILPDLKTADTLDGFVHTAAVQPCSPITETSLAVWNETLAVNLTAAFLGTRFLVPLMAGRGASIVYISSVHSMATSAGMAPYVASKGGLLAYTRAVALELAESGIRVNTICPGAVDTPMLEAGLKRSFGDSAVGRQNLIAQTPLKRLAQPIDIASAIRFLLDGAQSSFITGQSLVVDGGVLARLASE